MSEKETRNLRDVESMVAQLNAMVPTDHAKVEMKMYGGGPDESQREMNRLIYGLGGSRKDHVGISRLGQDGAEVSTWIRILRKHNSRELSSLT